MFQLLDKNIQMPEVVVEAMRAKQEEVAAATATEGAPHDLWDVSESDTLAAKHACAPALE